MPHPSRNPPQIKQAPRAARRPLGLAAVQADGWLAERIDRARVTMDNFTACLWWSGKQMWGYEAPLRWLQYLMMYGEYSGEYHPAIPEVVEKILALAAAGKTEVDYKTASIAHWLDSHFITGLLPYYQKFKDPRALALAVAKGRSIIRQYRRNKFYFASVPIRKLIELGQTTGDPRFLKTAEIIAREHNLDFMRRADAHGAAVCVALEGYLCLCEATGKRHYLDQVIKAWPAIRDRMFVTGGLGEILDFTAAPGESNLHGETCQTVDWMMLNLQLWRLTGETKYLDLAERIIFNQYLFFHQLHRAHDGGFTAMNDIDQGFRGEHNYICCDGNGFRHLLELVTYIYSQDAAGKRVNVNFFLPAHASVIVAGIPVELRTTTSYPEQGAAEITVTAGAPVQFALGLRIPGWTRPADVIVNGQSVEFQQEETYTVISRTWQKDDAVKVVFPMPLRVETDVSGKGPRIAKVKLNGKIVDAKRIAVLYGPVVAVIFRTGHGNDLSWVWTGDYPEVLDCGGSAFEGYPGSRADVLEMRTIVRHSGQPPALTEVETGLGVPVLRWSQDFTRRTRITREVKILPGLPVTLVYRDQVDGWRDEPGRFLLGGLRFALLKTNYNERYVGNYAWPYSFPAVTTNPDLNNMSGCEKGNGTFSFYERLDDNAQLAKTGLFRITNDNMRVICLYDLKNVERVTCRRTDKWVGVYFEPFQRQTSVLTRRLVFPLARQPLCQTFYRQQVERAARVRAKVSQGRDGVTRLVLSGPLVQGRLPLVLPKTVGLRAGAVIRNNNHAAKVLAYDARHVVVTADVPGSYRVG